MIKRLFVLILLCSNNAIPASYKWVDEHNQTHYSEQPPANKKARVLPSSSSVNDTATSGVPSVPKTIAERATELDKAKLAKKDIADKAAQKQAYDDALKANCDGARRNLAALKDGIRLVEMDANGERSYMTDDQRQQKTAKAQQDIQENCK